MQYKDIAKRFPKSRDELPIEYKKIYDSYYAANRNGKTKITYLSSKMESWMHKKVANTCKSHSKTLEIGAGTLNQLNYENCSVYDIVEPYNTLFQNSPQKECVRNIFSDISEIPLNEKYNRITSIACFEHICNLPEVIEKVAQLLTEDGVLSVSIPNQGRFLWKVAYRLTTGKEFEKKFGLKYDILMNYEHVNSADEIDIILKYFFKSVRCSYFGFGKSLSIYRYYECKAPKILNSDNKGVS